MVTYKIGDAYTFCNGPCYSCKELSVSGDYYHVWEHGSDDDQPEYKAGPFDCCLDCARALGLVW